LDSKDASLCRSDLRQKRWISIFGEYNEGETLYALFDRLCTDDQLELKEPGAVCSRAPADLSVNGLPGEVARINHSNGAIEITVVTQAGKPNPDLNPSVPSFNYILSLNTDASHLDEDLAVFRAVLNAVKLDPAAPVPVPRP
jgi:hypothetical protein